MKGILKFILAIVLFLLVAAGASGIVGFLWTERHLFAAEPLPMPAPELDLPHQSRLIKLLPLSDFIKENRSLPSRQLDLTETETNWLLNYYFSREKPGNKIELKLEQNRITGKYSRKLNERKYQNLRFDATVQYQNCIIQVDLERLQLGDYLVPTTVLGQLGYLAEFYLQKQYCSPHARGFTINDLQVRPDSVQLTLVRKQMKSGLSSN